MFLLFSRQVMSSSITPWTAAYQASWILCKFMSIELVMLYNHLILCCPPLLLPSVFPSISVFSSESVVASGGQSIGASASASGLPMNIQGWFPLWLTALISKQLSRIFSITTAQKHQFFSVQMRLERCGLRLPLEDSYDFSRALFEGKKCDLNLALLRDQRNNVQGY